MHFDHPDILTYLRRTTKQTTYERERLLAAGRAVVLDRGHIAVDLPFDALARWEQRELLDILRVHAVLGNSPDAVATRATAALVHGLWTRGPLTRLDIATNKRSGKATRVLPGPRGEPGLGLTVHRKALASPPLEEIDVVRGVRVTSLLRTVLDCLLREPASVALLATVSAARRAGPVTSRWDVQGLRAASGFLDLIRDELLALPPGTHGRRRALVVLDAADPLLESAGETVSLVFARAIGLPQPQAQARFRVAGHDYYGDLWWKGLGLLGEFDGYSKYGAAPHLVAEKEREDALRSLDIVRGFHRITWPMFGTRTSRRSLELRILQSLPGEARPLIIPDRDFGSTR